MAGPGETKEQMIKDQLSWDTRITASDITIKVIDSKAELSGTVSTYSEKLAAEDDALNVPGIKTVESSITVTHPEEFKVLTDSEIKDSINKMLIADSDIDSTRIEVAVNDGVVTLNGSVNSFWKKSRIEDMASRISGVVDILNNIKISHNTSYEDSKIASDIYKALKRNSIVNANDISVNVIDGVATLRGEVPDRVVKRTAYDKAAYTAGVVGINDEIVVK